MSFDHDELDLSAKLHAKIFMIMKPLQDLEV